MNDHPIMRGVLIGAALGVTVGAVGLAYAPPAPTATAATSDPIVMAELTVDQKVADLTRGRDCYQDHTGHEPTEAVVKVDGTTTVRVMTADDAWTAAHEGRVRVQAWCSAKEQS